MFSTLAPEHPRLILSEDALERLQRQAACDGRLRRYVDDVLAGAERDCRAPRLRDERTPTLIRTSRDCLRRVYSLGLAWRLTRERRFADAAIADLETVCAFCDWNPGHFLDTAEMTHAVAVGYDWLFHELEPATRERIRGGLRRHGLETGAGIYAAGEAWWIESRFNWNLVCHGGLLIGALALGEAPPARSDDGGRADGETALAEAVAERAVAGLRIALASYADDGAWAEGPVYWHLATRYVAYALSALATALGDGLAARGEGAPRTKSRGFSLDQGAKPQAERDLSRIWQRRAGGKGPTSTRSDSCHGLPGLDAMPGLAETGHFPIYLAGPTGQYVNFADSREKSRLESLPCSFWLTRTYGNSLFADQEHARLEDRPARPEHLVWYVAPTGRSPSRDLDRLFRGIVDVAVLRSSWTDPDALFVGVLSGSSHVGHGHLDLGSFELDALGVRWARDLGADDYGLPGYWARQVDGWRWTYYRLGSASHNVVTLDGENHDLGGRGRILELRSRPEEASVVLELTGAFPRRASRMQRGIALVAGRTAVLIQDELELTAPAEVAWGLTTDAEIELATARRALLTLDGRGLEARILASGARFAIESAERDPPESRNAGVRRLVARVAAPPGPLRVAVLLAPAAGPPRDAVRIRPLREW